MKNIHWFAVKSRFWLAHVFIFGDSFYFFVFITLCVQFYLQSNMVWLGPKTAEQQQQQHRRRPQFLVVSSTHAYLPFDTVHLFLYSSSSTSHSYLDRSILLGQHNYPGQLKMTTHAHTHKPKHFEQTLKKQTSATAWKRWHFTTHVLVSFGLCSHFIIPFRIRLVCVCSFPFLAFLKKFFD